MEILYSTNSKNEMTEFRGGLSRWRWETPDKGLQERCMKKSIPV